MTATVFRQSYMLQHPSLFTLISYCDIVFSFALMFANGWFTSCDGFYGASACWLSHMKQSTINIPTPMVTITKCQMLADANNYDLQNVECQSLIPSGKISSGSPRFAKWTIMNLRDVLWRRLCLQQSTPACALTHGCVTMLSDIQGCALSHFGLVLQLRHNGRESNIHSACNCACF